MSVLPQRKSRTAVDGTPWGLSDKAAAEPNFCMPWAPTHEGQVYLRCLCMGTSWIKRRLRQIPLPWSPHPRWPSPSPLLGNLPDDLAGGADGDVALIGGFMDKAADSPPSLILRTTAADAANGQGLPVF